MKRQGLTESKPMQALRKIALRCPEVQEGVVCTKAAFKARNTAFLFMGMDDTSYNTLLKLRESLPEAAKLAAKEPDRYGVGGHGWVSAIFSHDESPPPGLLEGWIDESYRLLVPKTLVVLLPALDATKAAKKKATRKS